MAVLVISKKLQIRGPQQTQRIGDDEQRGPNICRDGAPQSRQSEAGEDDEVRLHRKRGGDVLTDDGHGPARMDLTIEGGCLSFLSTTTVFGTTLDISLSEIAIESFLPADSFTAEAMRHLGGG